MTKSDLKIFFKIVLVTLAVSVIVDRIVYFGLNKISDKVYTGQGIGKLNQYLKIKDGLDFIVYGSSRANRHFVVKELSDNGFNVGIDGRKIAYPATLVQLLPENKRQTVIFNVDISYMIDSTYQGADVDALMPFYNRNKVIKKNIDELGQANPFQKLYSTIGYNGYVISILYNYIFPKYDYKTYDGYDPNYISPAQQENLKKLIAKSENEACPKEMEINEVTKRTFEAVAKFCKDNNKQLIFVSSPVFKDDCNADNQLVSAFMKKNGYAYYDYTNFFAKDNKLLYWKDLAHLSDNGAKLFSAQLSKDLRFRHSDF